MLFNSKIVFTVPVSLNKYRMIDGVYEGWKYVPKGDPGPIYCYVERANPLPKMIWRYKPHSCGSNDPHGRWITNSTKVIR